MVSTFDREKCDPNAVNTSLLRSDDMLFRGCSSVGLGTPSIEIHGMTSKRRIQRHEKFGLELTQAERMLIVESVAKLPDEIAHSIQATPAKQPIMLTLNDWRELGGHIASEANDAGDTEHQNNLDTIFLKIQSLLDKHADNGLLSSLVIQDNPTEKPLAEESVQLAELAARLLIGAEQLGIKTKIVARFPLSNAERNVLMTTLILSADLIEKLAVHEPHLTVGEVGGLLVAVSEALIDAAPLQQFALILTAKRLKDCLEAEINSAAKPGAKGTDEGEGHR